MSGGLRSLASAIIAMSLGQSAFAQSIDGEIFKSAQQALSAKYETQRILQAFNVEFDLLVKDYFELKDIYTYRLISPKTEAERVLRSSIEKQLPILESFHQVQNQRQFQLNELLNIKLKESEGYNNRALGLKVPAVFPLVLGHSVSNTFKREDSAAGRLGHGVREVCFSDKSRNRDALELFWNTTAGGISCAQPVERIELLEDSQESFNRKVELLTGSILPAELFENPDPNYKIDFSRAPEMNVIWMSYLEFKHDFVGRMMAQILEFHARRGTDIRILLPGLPIPGTNFVKAKDAQLLRNLEALGPNVQIKKFTFLEKNADLLTPLKAISRSQHAKMIVALAKDPQMSGVIVGGRNIKDTFHFKKTPDYSRWPEMVQYQRGDEKFGVFRDMEVFIRGQEFAEQTAAQLLSFWNWHKSGPKVIRNTEHLQVELEGEVWERLKNNPAQTYARHFISLPYVDDRAIEKLFEEMIDRAQSEVILVTPYLRPLKGFNQAIVRALKRGVRVELLTSLKLGNDNVAPFTEDMNKMSVNTFVKEYEKLKQKDPKLAQSENLLKVYDWAEDSVQHSKVILVDRKLVFVGSINLDQRGLTNDSENGVLMIGPPAREMGRIYDEVYMPLSRRLEGKQKINLAYPLLIYFLDLLNMT